MRRNPRYIRNILTIATASLTLVLGLPVIAATPAAFTQSVIDDMQKPDDGKQLNYNRTSYAWATMGLMARGDYTPVWWRPSNQGFKSSAWWTAITPWWQVVPLQGNTVASAKVEIGTIATVARKKGTQNWYTVVSASSGWAGVADEGGNPYAAPTESLGTLPGYKSNIYTMPGGSSTLHGGPGVFPHDAQGVDGLITCIAARVVGTNAAQAQVGMWAGTDYYPYAGADISQASGYWPGAMSGRLRKITTSWQAFCAAPLDNPGHAGDDGSYPNTLGAFMSTSTLKANPVPEMPGLLPAGAVTTPPPVVTPPIVTPPVVTPPVVTPPVATLPPVTTNPNAAQIKTLKQQIKALKLQLFALQTQLWNLM
jgi:hypothetical protein